MSRFIRGRCFTVNGSTIYLDAYQFEAREARRIARAYGMPFYEGQQWGDSPYEPNEIRRVDTLTDEQLGSLITDLDASYDAQLYAEQNRPSLAGNIYRWIKKRLAKK